MPEKTALVGWQGITVEAPADWSLVGVNGDAKKGYFRVDSPVASALEVKWEQAAGKKPDLMVKAREYLATIEKSVRKKKLKFTKDLKADKGDENSVRFWWRADRLGQGRIVYCEKCSRVIIAQAIATRDENIASTAADILDSMTDHREDGWVNWALYGLAFAVPPGYVIDKQKLMSGYLALFFKKGPRTISVERWGLANTLLVKDDMETWYRKDAVPDIKGYKVAFEPEAVAGHEGLRIKGRCAGLRQTAKAAAYSLTLHPYPALLTGYVWHCAESNRLFSIRASHNQGEDTAERIRDLVKCH